MAPHLTPAAVAHVEGIKGGKRGRHASAASYTTNTPRATADAAKSTVGYIQYATPRAASTQYHAAYPAAGVQRATADSDADATVRAAGEGSNPACTTVRTATGTASDSGPARRATATYTATDESSGSRRTSGSVPSTGDSDAADSTYGGE